MFQPTDELSDVRWLPVLNTSGEEIPSYAVMKVTGKDADTGMTTVVKPDADDMNTARLLINGPGVIAIDEAGAGTRDYPIMALVADAGGGAGPGVTGDGAGTVAGQWSLAAGGSGFTLSMDAEDGRAVVVGEGGGGSSAFKHYLITGQFVKDDPGLVSPASGYCFYPAVELLGPAGPLVDPTTGEAVWVIFRYVDAIVENIGAPFTVVGVDGTKVHLARKLNWPYAPDDGVTLHTGESRPVCYSHETAYAIAVDCSTDTPKAVTEG